MVGELVQASNIRLIVFASASHDVLLRTVKPYKSMHSILPKSCVVVGVDVTVLVAEVVAEVVCVVVVVALVVTVVVADVVALVVGVVDVVSDVEGVDVTDVVGEVTRQP